MNTIDTHHPHHHRHLLAVAIATSAAVVAAGLLTGPVELPFGGEGSETVSHATQAQQATHTAVVSVGALTGRCVHTTHSQPGDVPAALCSPDVTHVRRTSQPTAPVPCYRQFRVAAADTAPPAGCD